MATKTTMNLPEELLKEAVQVSGAQTKTMAVILGLEELIRKKRLEGLLKLKGSGKVHFSRSDLKQSRRR